MVRISETASQVRRQFVGFHISFLVRIEMLNRLVKIPKIHVNKLA